MTYDEVTVHRLAPRAVSLPLPGVAQGGVDLLLVDVLDPELREDTLQPQASANALTAELDELAGEVVQPRQLEATDLSRRSR
jgi:hypothetical protein